MTHQALLTPSGKVLTERAQPVAGFDRRSDTRSGRPTTAAAWNSIDHSGREPSSSLSALRAYSLLAQGRQPASDTTEAVVWFQPALRESMPCGTIPTRRRSLRATRTRMQSAHSGFTHCPGRDVAQHPRSARGLYGPATTAAVKDFQIALGVQATAALGHDVLHALVETTPVSPIASRSYLALALDMEWTGFMRLVALTARFEAGGKFTARNRNTDHAGLSFGILQWAQKPGRLAGLLRAFQRRSPTGSSPCWGGRHDRRGRPPRSRREAERRGQRPWTDDRTPIRPGE